MSSEKLVKLCDIMDIIRRLKEDGYVKQFYKDPTPYFNLTTESDKEIYTRPYERNLVKHGGETDNKIVEDILEKYCQNNEEYKKNTNLKTVLTKITLLNAFYRTTLNNIHLVAIARYLCSLDIDNRIVPMKDGQPTKEPNFDLIHDIAYHHSDLFAHQGNTDFLQFRVITKNGIVSHTNSMYSFASKYCAWHQPTLYPIVDSYTKGVLYHIVNDNKENEDFQRYIEYPKIIRSKKLSHSMLNNYQIYYAVYNGLRRYLQKNGITLSLKDLDIFLWSYGMEHNISDDCSEIYLIQS